MRTERVTTEYNCYLFIKHRYLFIIRNKYTNVFITKLYVFYLARIPYVQILQK